MPLIRLQLIPWGRRGRISNKLNETLPKLTMRQKCGVRSALMGLYIRLSRWPKAAPSTQPRLTILRCRDRILGGNVYKHAHLPVGEKMRSLQCVSLLIRISGCPRQPLKGRIFAWGDLVNANLLSGAECGLCGEDFLVQLS
jgi:hypothetical protein